MKTALLVYAVAVGLYLLGFAALVKVGRGKD